MASVYSQTILNTWSFQPQGNVNGSVATTDLNDVFSTFSKVGLASLSGHRVWHPCVHGDFHRVENGDSHDRMADLALRVKPG